MLSLLFLNLCQPNYRIVYSMAARVTKVLKLMVAQFQKIKVLSIVTLVLLYLVDETKTNEICQEVKAVIILVTFGHMNQYI